MRDQGSCNHFFRLQQIKIRMCKVTADARIRLSPGRERIVWHATGESAAANRRSAVIVGLRSVRFGLVWRDLES